MSPSRSGGRAEWQGDYGHLAPLFEEMAALPRDDPARAELRQRLVTEHLPIAEHIAMRFSHPGEPVEDLTQVARRSFANLTQTQIARRIGISQMRVSRLLARSLAELRAELTVGEPNHPGGRTPRSED